MKATLALVFVALSACSGERNSRSPSEVPQMLDDASGSKPVAVELSTKLDLRRATDSLSVAIEQSSLRTTNLVLGSNMFAGIECKFFVYPKGESRPLDWSIRTGPGRVELGTHHFNRERDGLPLQGTEYLAEVDVILFETDIPPQRQWSPESGADYRVLSRETLKASVP